MLLREYIEKQGIPIAELGRRVGVLKRQTMHKYVKGESLPDRDVQRRIAAETGNLVLPVDLEAAHAKYRAERAA
jgi:hypothetical protein